MANRKISDLTALTAPATGDLLPIVDISEAAAADKNKKITYGELLASAPAGSAAAPSFSFDADPNTGIYSPGADQLAITTSGTGRLFVDASGNVNIDSNTLYVDAVNKRVGFGTVAPAATLHSRADNAGSGSIALLMQNRSVAANTAVGISFAPNVSDSGDRSAIIYGVNTSGGSGNATDLTFHTNANGSAATEKARIDSSGRLLVGVSIARTAVAGVTPSLQIEGGNDNSAALSIIIDDNTSIGSSIYLGKSRGATTGSTAIVAAGDTLGTVSFAGADGTALVSAARIDAYVDGAPGANDMPGRLVFSTFADGAASPTERLRITNDGVQCYNQPTPATYAAAATLTVADLKTAIITYTGAAATLTLPTGTLTEGGFAGIYTNMTFEWSVINTGSGLCTIGAGTAHTITGGATIAAGASGRFASRRTAQNTFVSYRLS